MSWWVMGGNSSGIGRGSSEQCAHAEVHQRREAIRVGKTGEIPEDDGGGNELGVLPARGVEHIGQLPVDPVSYCWDGQRREVEVGGSVAGDRDAPVLHVEDAKL